MCTKNDRLILLVLGVLISLITHAHSSDDEVLRTIDFGKDDIDVVLIRYDKPILIFDGRFEGDGLGWWKPYAALRNFRDGWVYEDWIGYFSDEYIKRYSIDQSMFDMAKAQPKTDVSNPPVRSVIYQLEVKIGDREFSVNQIYNGKLEEVPESLSDLPYFTATQVFEKIDGRWKVQLIDELGSLSKLPFGDIEKIVTISERQSGYESASGVLE